MYQTPPESSTLDFIFLFLFLNFIFMANTWITNKFSTLWACLLLLFKQQFSIFKQYYTYFYTLFHPHVFSQNNFIKNLLPNGPYIYSHHIRLSNSNPNPKFLISHLPNIFSCSIHVFWFTRRSFTSHKHTNFRQYS